MKLENRKQKVAPLPHFLFRLGRYGLFALGLIVFSGLLGTVGYPHFGQISWLDSFHMACMILTGMGPIVEMTSSNAKLFSSLFGTICPTSARRITLTSRFRQCVFAVWVLRIRFRITAR